MVGIFFPQYKNRTSEIAEYCLLLLLTSFLDFLFYCFLATITYPCDSTILPSVSNSTKEYSSATAVEYGCNFFFSKYNHLLSVRNMKNFFDD